MSKPVGHAMPAYLAAIAVLAVIGTLASSTAARAQTPPPQVQASFVPIGPLSRLAAAVYRPVGGAAPHVAFIYMNGGSSAMTHPACAGLAQRGFVALCATTRQENTPINSHWEDQALDVKAAVEFLRKQPGITRVVLLGHSGGGADASFYQATAENGITFCQDAKKLSRCGDTLANLPPADAIVFPDAHPGLGVMSTRQINPSVTFDLTGGIKVDASLDPYNPANGFDPNGPSHYSKAFQQRYFAAQAKTVNGLLDLALKVKAEIDAGTLKDPRDNLIMIPAWALVAHLDILDPTIPGLMQTSQPRKFLRNDGTIVTQIVESVSPSEFQMVKSGQGVDALHIDGATHFLSEGGVRATDSLDQIDYCTSNSVTMCNVQSIHVPVLFAAMGASTFIGDDERMYERSASKDKDYVVVEGALHGFTPCTRCEKTPGQYSHSLDNTLDYVRDWVNKRF